MYYPKHFPKNPNKEQTVLRYERIGLILDGILDPRPGLDKQVFRVEGEILDYDKPNVWNVYKKGNMEKALEVDFQKFGIAVTEHTGQILADVTTMTFYATVDYLKEKFRK